MTNKTDFLSLLQRNRAAIDETDALRDIRAVISLQGHSPMLAITDASLHPVQLETNNLKSTHARLVSACRRVTDSMALSFDWTADYSENRQIPIADYPFLVPLIVDCADILVDSSGNPLAVEREAAPLRFTLHKVGRQESHPPYFKGDFTTGDRKVDCFISDQYAMTDDGIRRVRSVGQQFGALMALTNSVEANLLELYLSVLFSAVNNVNVDVEGYDIIRDDTPVKAAPTIIFEKVDDDNALHLRVTESVGSLPPELTDSMALSYVATVDGNKIIVKPLSEGDGTASFNDVRRSVTGSAPSRTAAKEVWSDGNVMVIPAEVASTFLSGGLPSLLTRYRLIGADKLKSYRITATHPTLHLRLGSGIDFLEGSASVEIADQTFTINDLLNQYARTRYITLSDGTRAIVDETYMKRLNRIFVRARGKGDKVKVSFFDLPEVMEMLDAKDTQEKAFARYRKFYEGFGALADAKIQTPGLKARLRGYQKDGVKWIDYLYRNNMGGCLADDMGLGKTVQTIGQLCRTVPKQTSPSLIVMPRSLLFNWQQEFDRFAPHIKVSSYYGLARDLDESLKADVILTSYAVARNDIEQLMKHEFDYVILDESQNIKNVDAQMTKAVWLLKARHRLAISGTPIENNLTELYSLFHFLNPAMFGSMKDFNDRYAAPIQKDGDADAATALRTKIYPFMLRRLKKDVIVDLPERTEQTLMVEMSERQAALYEERRRYFAGEVEAAFQSRGAEKARFELLRALGELRQIASVPEEKTDGTIASPKIELLVANVLQAVENGHKVVVFYNFLAGIELTGQQLDKAGVGYDVMTGATQNRRRVVENFSDNPDCKVLLMTVKTGGVGLNLVCADTVFIAEPWWNKAAEDQAINRLHRIGQKNAVNCYYMITANTIEEKIRQLQEQKSALVDAVISSDASGKTLTPQDIEYLLS